MFASNNTSLKAIILKIWSFVDNYYLLFVGAFFLFPAVKNLQYTSVGVFYKISIFLYVFAALTAFSDLRKDVKWIPFLLISVPFLLLVGYISVHGYDFWGKMISWELKKTVVVDLNPIFRKIPFNNGSFARIYKPAWLTYYMRMVYNNGFVFPVLIPIYRSMMAKDFKKMVKYTLSAHILQVFLITPFYVTFHLQEVWYVLGQPDGLARVFSSPQAAAGTVLNCFPSMHTSINIAVFLLVLREKDKLFKFVWSFFCLSVVYSTLYLEIHWVIDVIGGIALAFLAVKIVDFVLDKGEVLLMDLLNAIYYRKAKSVYIKNYYLDTL